MVDRFGNSLQLILSGLLKGSRAFSTGNTGGESFNMLHVGGIRDKPELKCSYYHRKWIQIKHYKQNSGEDWAVSLPLVADNPIGWDWSSVICYAVPSYNELLRSLSGQYQLSVMKEKQKRKRRTILSTSKNFLLQVNWHPLYAALEFRRLAIILTNNTPENCITK